MKKLFIILLLLVITTGCNKIEENKTNNNMNEVTNKMTAVINNKEYTINLEDNDTVKALTNMLPLELTMNELNGNEKYVYLNSTLPTKEENVKKINAGDVMLYQDNCLVIFYKSFNTSYQYTRIGHINNLADLGNGNITLKLAK